MRTSFDLAGLACTALLTAPAALALTLDTSSQGEALPL